MSDENDSKAAPTSSADQTAKKRKRRTRPFPAMTFEEALQLAIAIQERASGKKVRRLTLFDAMGRSPETAASRDLITASGQYGITKGAYNAEHIELTAMGAQATSPESSDRDRTSARLQLAIAKIHSFNTLYEAFNGNRMPSKEVMQDKLRETGMDDEFVAEGVETFILNGQFTGIIKEIAGAERIISFEQALEGKSGEKGRRAREVPAQTPALPEAPPPAQQGSDWDRTCFYITPIGTEDSEERQHSDLFMGSIIEPALEEFGLKVVRADQIEKPGMITKQIIEYILKARLVIADLHSITPMSFTSCLCATPAGFQRFKWCARAIEYRSTLTSSEPFK
jgi:hypothetical protein